MSEQQELEDGSSAGDTWFDELLGQVPEETGQAGWIECGDEAFNPESMY